jgi:histone acetyltransferase (RNA polymerase elongator complex component)
MGCSDANSDRNVDIEELDRKYDALIKRTFEYPTQELLDTNPNYINVVETILLKDKDYKIFNNLKQVMRKYSIHVKNSYVFQVYLLMKERESYKGRFCEDDDIYIRSVLQIKAGKSHSGIISVTVFTSGYPEFIDPKTGEQKKQVFSCAFDCFYCPNEPGGETPRSYLKGEPGVMRATRSNFDCLTQMFDRMKALYLCGHECDKLEVLVLGGTWTSYPIPYREQFIRDIYYSANTFFDMFANTPNIREKLSLTEEKLINKTTRSKVIGLTLETRPDTITAKELKLLRYYGCTRVQLGIQHLDNDVLTKINRKCKTETTIKGIKLLKDAGYKIDGHFMPNLPGSTPDKDKNMLINELLGVQEYTRTEDIENQITTEKYKLSNENVQVDQWKVYPTTIVPWTEIEKWYKSGEYVPYDMDEMKEILLETITKVFPWIRLNRIVRDIPDDYSILTNYRSNMRQDLDTELKKQGKFSYCIRNREVKTQNFDMNNMFMVIREYDASDGTEYFISFESQDNKLLYGFIRLRLTNNQPIHIFPELEGCALIRELHVYGKLQPVGNKTNHVQHSGLGRRLLQKAENIAKTNKYNKISVIAGEGTRGYYEKFGYIDNFGEGRFMIKDLC